MIANDSKWQLERNRSEIGTVQRVLVEGPSKRSAAQLAGRTDGNKMVVFDAGRAAKGRRYGFWNLSARLAKLEDVDRIDFF